MRILFAGLAAFFLILALAGPAAAQDGKVFHAESFTLDNGLQVVVVPNHRTPVVTHMVWYKVGSAEEQRGKSGIAHFLEHLMFKGSDGLKPGEFSERVRAMGGNDNAFTAQDYTAYFQSVPVDKLETVMEMEAGRMRGLNPPPEQVLSERLVILEERRQRTDNEPRARFNEQMNAALYVNHPYGTPIIGWAHEIASLTWEDAKSFYDLWYAPNNAILIVSGDVTGTQVRDLAEKIYGGLERRDVPARMRATSPPSEALINVTLRDATVREPAVQKVYRVPSARQNKAESLALQVLEEIMGGGPTSRLYKALVIDQKIATAAGLSYRSASWDDSELWIYAAPTPGTAPEIVMAALEQELEALAEKGVTPEELNDALTRMQAEAIYARDSLTGPAMVFGQALTTGSSVEDVEYWPRDIAAVTAEQVQQAAQKYLNAAAPPAQAPVSGYLLPPLEEAQETPAPSAPAQETAP